MKLTRTDAVFSRTAMMLSYVEKQKFLECPENPRRHFLENIKNTGERIKTRGPTPCPRGWGRAYPLGAPPASWDPWSSTDLNSKSIYSRSGRKNQREGFIVFYDTEPPPSPKLSREG